MTRLMWAESILAEDLSKSARLMTGLARTTEGPAPRPMFYPLRLRSTSHGKMSDGAKTARESGPRKSLYVEMSLLTTPLDSPAGQGFESLRDRLDSAG